MSQPSASKIQVAFCTDLAYVQHVGVALASLLEHNPAAGVQVHVVSPPLGADQTAALVAVAAPYGAELLFVVIDATVVDSLREHMHISRAMYYRILLPRLPQLAALDRIIYLDCDMVIEADLTELWTMELDGCGCAGVDEGNPVQTQRLGLDGDIYVNSGTLVMDLAHWRANDVTEQCMAWLAVNEAVAILPDQDAINVVLRNRKKPIDIRWNLNPVPWNDITMLARFPSRIVHFGGPIKPWHRHYDFDLQAIYKKYLDKTPWAASFKLKEPTNVAQSVIVANQLFERGDHANAAVYYAEALRRRLLTTKLESMLLFDVLNAAHRHHNAQSYPSACELYRACFKHWGMPVQHAVNIYTVPELLAA